MMDSTELYEHFRSEVSDTAKPYLWSDDEVWRYATDAYRMFVRLTGGIADVTSDATRIAIITGEPTSPMHSSILRVMRANRVSDGGEVQVINQFDLMNPAKIHDYGFVVQRLNVPKPGNVNHMVIGRQRYLVHFLAIPQVDDTVQMSVYRLPLKTLTGDGQSLDEIGEEHHIHLIPWMKRMAYRKHDVETLDLKKSEAFEAEFNAYCALVRAEWDRMKHKNREVAYGGI